MVYIMPLHGKLPKEDMPSQMNNLLTSDMLKTLFCILTNVCMTLPVEIASVERSFSQIKTPFRNSLGEKCLTDLIKIAIESPQKLTSKDIETIIEI